MANFALTCGGRPLAGRTRKADNLLSRFMGLMGRKGLDEGEALYIAPCSSIHTFFMRFPIDVAFVDRENRVVKVAEAVKPWRVLMGAKGAHAVVELSAGSLGRAGVADGDQLELQPA